MSKPSPQPEIVQILKADGLNSMLTEAINNDLNDGSVQELQISHYSMKAEGETIVYGDGIAIIEQTIPENEFYKFNFEVNTGSSKTETVIFDELEVVIEYE